MLKLLIFVALSTTCLCYPVDDTNIQNPVEQQQQQVQPTPQQTDKQTKNSALPRDILKPDGNLSKQPLVGKPDNSDLKTEPSEWEGFGRDFDHGHDHGHGHDHHDHDHGHHHHDHDHGHHHHDHGHYHGHGHGYGHGNGFEFGFGYPNYHRPYYNTYYPSYGPSIYPQYYPQNNYVGGGSIFW